MIFNLTIAPLIILLVIREVSLCPTEDEQQFANTLDTLLKFSGWKEIKMRAKCWAPAGNETESFSGKDLVTKIDYQLDLNEEYKEDMENRIVDEKNAETKYYMTLRLLGCVYTDVLLRLFTFFKFLIDLCNSERLRAFILIDDTQKKPRGILTDVLQHMEKCKSNTEYMFIALNYVIGIVPVKDCENSLMIDVTKITIPTKKLVYQIFARIRHHMKSLEIMSSNGSKENDNDYKLRIAKSSTALMKSIDNVLKGHLLEFKRNHCVEPAESDEASINKWFVTLKKKCMKSNVENFVSIIDIEIKQIVDVMVETYYSNLGFVNWNEITTLSKIIPNE